MTPDLDKWRKPWSVTEYLSEAANLRPDGIDGFTFKLRRRNYLLAKPHPDGTADVVGVLEAAFLAYRHVGELVAERLDSRSQRDRALVTEFSFPLEVRGPCEQYLLHFVDFLRDLGVEALAELKQSPAGVLFTVAPSDHRVALDRIRIALEAYLKLPSAEFAGIPKNVTEELTIAKLQMNVQHLRAQLAAADAQRLALFATVEAQRFSISALRQLREPVLSSSTKTSDTEPLIEGVVALTKIRKGGLEVDVPELYRRLRKLFQRRR